MTDQYGRGRRSPRAMRARGQERVRNGGPSGAVPRTPPRPAPLRRAHGPLRRALLAALRRTRPRRAGPRGRHRADPAHARVGRGRHDPDRPDPRGRARRAPRGRGPEHRAPPRRAALPVSPRGVTVTAIDDQRPGRPPAPGARSPTPRSRACPAVLMDRRDRGARATTLWTDACLARRLRAVRGGVLMGTAARPEPPRPRPGRPGRGDRRAGAHAPRPATPRAMQPDRRALSRASTPSSR